MKVPPPSPDDCGSTKLSTNCTATAASAALPPARSISRPASTAAPLAAATMKDFAVPSWTLLLPVADSGAGRSWARTGCSATICAAVKREEEVRPSGCEHGLRGSGKTVADVVRLFEEQGNPAP